MLVVNFKSYQQASGKKALQLAKICSDISKKTHVNIILAPQFTDLGVLKKFVSLPLIAQHVDPVYQGRYTGHVSLFSLISVGVHGSLLNHSEKKLPFNQIKETIKLARKHKFKIFALASNLKEAKKIAKLRPYALAFEPPELIGTGRSVSKTKPQLVKKFVSLVDSVDKKIKKLCGAGITNGEDVKVALELGVDGVIVASAIVLAKNRRKTVKDIVSPFQ